MKKMFLSKLKEASISVLPIVLIVVAMALILGFDFNFIFQFVFSSLFLIFGLALFTLGADISMIEIGQKIGGYLAKKNWLTLTLISTLFIGIVITVAEPDLIVLANQVSESMNPTLLIIAIALGVGVYMVVSTLRTRFKLPLNIILLVSYLAVFVIAFFLPENFYPLALDGGSVTTGPISVPFIMAFGIGLATVSSIKGKSNEDSFGTVGLVSVGPILAVMILGLFIMPEGMTYSFAPAEGSQGVGNIILDYLKHLPSEFLNVCLIILPIFVFFLLFQFFALKLPIKNIFKILIGILLVVLGITFFLSAANFGFLCTGQKLGLVLGVLEQNWVIVPIFALIGLVIVLAEPAVHVLGRQIETVTSGVVSKKTMFFALCLGVCVSLILVCIRLLTGINILWIVIPLFALCFILTFLVPKMFTGIAFDSGGVVTGAMSTTFVLPMIIGIVYTIGGNAGILTNAFGSLAIIAGSPIISVLIVGAIFKLKENKSKFRVKTKRAIIVDFE